MHALRILGIVCLVLCTSHPTVAQTTIDTVAPGITATDHTADSIVFAQGYFNASDGGSGTFSKVSGTCTITISGDTNSTKKIANVSSTAGLFRGTGIAGSGIPSGAWITGFGAH